MTREDVLLERLAVHEGGYVNHPSDPGGPTNKGVTQHTYDAWRKKTGKSVRSVQQISEEEVSQIYLQEYFAPVKANLLPIGLDYAMVDFAVNSGPGRAVMELQKILGVEVDGVLGAFTLGAIKDVEELIVKLCDQRLRFMKGLRHWNTFATGWTRRVGEVKEMALSDWQQMPVAQPSGVAIGKAPKKMKERDMFNTTVNKAVIAALGGLSALGATLGLPELDPVTVQAISAVVTAFLVWLVPNKQS